MYGESQIVALDISKAFDRVWHKALVVKMKSFGIHPSLLAWTECFLSNRSIRVVMDGTLSDEFCIDAGVPQGSALSPTLFLIFINDLLSVTQNSIHSFADDSTLHYSYNSRKPISNAVVNSCRSRMITSLNEDLERVLEWGRLNLVTFNSSKTQSCLLSHKRSGEPENVVVGGKTIINAPSLQILGSNFDSKLTWRDQIFGVGKNAARRLGFLRRCKRYFSSQDLAVIYKAYIRPLLEYDSHIWAGAPSSTLAFLDRIQNRAVRLINDASIQSNIDSLHHRRNVGATTLFYRYHYGRCSVEIFNLMPQPSTHVRNTRLALNRHGFSVNISSSRTVSYRNSFISRTSRLWNQLPAHVFPPIFDINKFKSNINLYLRTHPFLG